MSAPLGSWIDGVRGETLPADDRGLHYGDGLFETIGVRAGIARFLEAHLARLTLGMRAPRDSPSARWRSCVRRSRRRWRWRHLERCSRSSSRVAARVRRGYAPRAPNRRGACCRCGPQSPCRRGRGRRRDCTGRHHGSAENPALAGHQTSEPARERARRRRGRQRQAPLTRCCWMVAGHVVSGAMSNVFLVRDGQRADTAPRSLRRGRRDARHGAA